MNLKESIKYRMTDFLSLCKAHNVKNLYAFGSSITDEFNEESSDIDLLIEIDNDDPIERGENLTNIWDQFEKFFQRTWIGFTSYRAVELLSFLDAHTNCTVTEE